MKLILLCEGGKHTITRSLIRGWIIAGYIPAFFMQKNKCKIYQKTIYKAIKIAYYKDSL